MNRLLKPLVLALTVCAATTATASDVPPMPKIQSAGAPVIQPEHGREPSQSVTTWMLTYRNSWGAASQVLQSVEGLVSRAACEATWIDIKEVLSQSLPERLVMPYKCIRVEKRAR
jgi:hypothetical protein